MSVTYEIRGMHCGHCVGRIKTALQPLAEKVEVTLSPPRAVLTDPKTGATRSAIERAVASAGAYTLAPSAATSAPIASAASDESDRKTWIQTYWPLLLIAGYLAIASFAGVDDGSGWMTNFMAGFFLVFSAFKFLDLPGFADAYASYDLLAKSWHGYGFIYPFLELALGFAYLFRFEPVLTNVATLALMGFSSLGVLDALRNKRRIVCACLGTVLNLPMSTVTLVEDVGMAAMAAIALLGLGHN